MTDTILYFVNFGETPPVEGPPATSEPELASHQMGRFNHPIAPEGTALSKRRAVSVLDYAPSEAADSKRIPFELSNASVARTNL